MRENKATCKLHYPSNSWNYLVIGDFATPFILRTSMPTGSLEVPLGGTSTVIKGATTYFNLFTMVCRILNENSEGFKEEIWFFLSDYSVPGDYKYIECCKRIMIRHYKCKAIRFVFDQASKETKNHDYVTIN